VPSSPARQFQSCLVIAPRSVNTLPLVRALHTAGLAVLERWPDASSLSLAGSGEFALIACFCDGMFDADVALIDSLSRVGPGVVAILEEATPDLVAHCLEAGADACVELGADERLIVAQVHAILRRRRVADPADSAMTGVLKLGDLTVDIDRCEVERAGEFIPLTASEYRIVEHMARNAGRVLRPHEILNAVADGYVYSPREAQEVFKVYVRRIRRKLEPSELEPRYLLTVRGIGYRLEGASASGAWDGKTATQIA
jgi:two-component system response regulator RegX3